MTPASVLEAPDGSWRGQGGPGRLSLPAWQSGRLAALGSARNLLWADSPHTCHPSEQPWKGSLAPLTGAAFSLGTEVDGATPQPPFLSTQILRTWN